MPKPKKPYSMTTHYATLQNDNYERLVIFRTDRYDAQDSPISFFFLRAEEPRHKS